jgi:nucleoside-diphosphate-sugar epimerase
MVGQGVTQSALEAGHKVIALDIGPESTYPSTPASSRGNLKYYSLDATDFEAYLKILKDEGVDSIIHLAATFNKFDENGQYLSHVPSNVGFSSSRALLMYMHKSTCTQPG